jgi:hypothetical protein
MPCGSVFVSCRRCGYSLGTRRLQNPPRGVARQCKAHLQTLHPRGPGGVDEGAQENRAVPAGHRQGFQGAESALEHGLHRGKAGGRAAASNSDGAGPIHAGVRDDCGESPPEQSRCRLSARRRDRRKWPACLDHRGQRQGVRREGDGRLGPSHGIQVAFLRQADPRRAASSTASTAGCWTRASMSSSSPQWPTSRACS